jgi:hypothetical protein
MCVEKKEGFEKISELSTKYFVISIDYFWFHFARKLYLIVLLYLYPSKIHSHYHTSFDENEYDRPTPYSVKQLEAN